MAWIVKLVSIGAEGEEHSTDVMRIARPDDLADLATLGLGLAEGKRLLAGVQQEIVAAQARLHAARRPECRGCGAACRVKDYRHHNDACGRHASRIKRASETLNKLVPVLFSNCMALPRVMQREAVAWCPPYTMQPDGPPGIPPADGRPALLGQHHRRS